jgi:hypothetical protein
VVADGVELCVVPCSAWGRRGRKKEKGKRKREEK